MKENRHTLFSPSMKLADIILKNYTLLSVLPRFGAVTKWLTFVAALIGASLPVTGYILYFRRIRRRRK